MQLRVMEKFLVSAETALTSQASICPWQNNPSSLHAYWERQFKELLAALFHPQEGSQLQGEYDTVENTAESQEETTCLMTSLGYQIYTTLKST